MRDVEAHLEALPEVALLSVQVGNQGGTDYPSIVQEMPVNQPGFTRPCPARRALSLVP